MFAVIETGGKQYKVKQGDIIDIEKISVEEGGKVEFDKVLLVADDTKIEIGAPFIKDAKVVAEFLKQDRDKKVIAFKQKRRKNFKKKIGHRQAISVLKIEEIKI